jgi:hypothetical protein
MPDPKDYKTVGFSRTSGKTIRERQLSKDLDAYKRIRKEGVQPKGIDGCAKLEQRAHDRMEIEMGHLFSTPEEWGKAKQGMALAAEIQENMKLERIKETLAKKES